uniref:NADH-ubiquinone oxidoreductase chain 6 n=1 Tax=Eucidaris tribuloides TaxID=7632 RepID=A0A7G3KY47_EUCTR|nr:NADH dehydrogenase subunit 6 [Eucidaris tribuloides]QEF30100.1 NADH dehydrogenase subunit 6 [Eucidaris tribuloides]QEF30139.1 NADH dehydrogenase subunit 6 [Eucidaris tribuloides]
MIVYFFLVLMLAGSTLVFYSLSPYYSALGLVIVAVSGCVVLGILGGAFVALILLLIYMGGMLVVFAYSSALSAERFPMVSNLSEILGLSLFFSSWVFVSFDNFQDFFFSAGNIVNNVGLGGSSTFYGVGGVLVLLGVFILLVALVAALIISRGAEASVLRAL